MQRVLLAQRPAAAGWLVLVLVLSAADGCTTFGVTAGASADGQHFAGHSNDWASSPSPGLLSLVPAADHPAGANRSVSGGQIPQVRHSFKYFTEGYGVMNEHQLAVAESTCAAKPYPRMAPNRGRLNIVDLSRLVLERSATARAGVRLMGKLAERYGYKDSAESLLVADPTELYIFHILRAPAAVGAVWVAERVPNGSIAAVANAFTIRRVDFASRDFLYSAGMKDAAAAAGWWAPGQPFDFTATFAAGSGPLYACGRRMWRIFSLLAPEVALPAEYDDYVKGAPYPAHVPASNVSRAAAFRVMRDFYNSTSFALNAGMAGGYGGTPERWASPGRLVAVTDPDTGKLVRTVRPGAHLANSSWERAISLYRSQISFVCELRRWLPNQIGGLAHWSPGAAHGGSYVALAIGMTALPASVTNGTSWAAIERWSLSWGTRYLFQILQLRFDAMYQQFSAARVRHEARLATIVNRLEAECISKDSDEQAIAMLDTELARLADGTVQWLWGQSEALITQFANNANLGYPAWWLASPEVGYPGTTSQI